MYEETSPRSHDFFLGFFFLFLQILVIVRNIHIQYLDFYWYCDFSAGVFALFFFLRNHQAVKGLMHIGLIGQGMFVGACVTKLLFGTSLLGFDVDINMDLFSLISTIAIHLTAPLVLYATIHTEPRPVSLAYALLFLCCMYVPVVLFTSPARSIDGNFNYIYGTDHIQAAVFPTFWIPIAFVLVVYPTYLLERALYRYLTTKPAGTVVLKMT